MIVIAATTNPVKIEAIRNAFERYFADVKVIPVEVQSGVPSQPVNEEVFKGAQNRIQELKKTELECDWDVLISCEGGMINMYGDWFNVQVVQIEMKGGKVGKALSQGFQIPQEYVDEAMKTSIAKVLDRLFDGKGGIRILTRGQLSRKNLIEDGTVMALARLLNDVW